MTVECQNEQCRDCYAVEPDPFGDGAVTYYVSFMTREAEDE